MYNRATRLKTGALVRITCRARKYERAKKTFPGPISYLVHLIDCEFMINFSRTKPRRTGSRFFPLFPLLVALVAMVYPKNGKKSVCVYSKSAKKKQKKKWGNCALRHRRRLVKVCGNKMTPSGGVQNGRDAALPKPQFTIFSRPRVRPYMAASAGSLSKDSFALPPTQPSPVWKPPPTPLPRYRCALGNEHPYAANCGFGGSLATVALGRDSSVFLCLASPMLFVWVCVCVCLCRTRGSDAAMGGTLPSTSNHSCAHRASIDNEIMIMTQSQDNR